MHIKSSKGKISPSPAQTYLWPTQQECVDFSTLTFHHHDPVCICKRYSRLPRNLEIKEGNAEKGCRSSEGKASMEIFRKGWAEGRDEDKKMLESSKLGQKGKPGLNVSGTDNHKPANHLTLMTDSGVSHTNSLCFDPACIKFRHDQNKKKNQKTPLI